MASFILLTQEGSQNEKRIFPTTRRQQTTDDNFLKNQADDFSPRSNVSCHMTSWEKKRGRRQQSVRICADLQIWTFLLFVFKAMPSQARLENWPQIGSTSSSSSSSSSFVHVTDTLDVQCRLLDGSHLQSCNRQTDNKTCDWSLKTRIVLFVCNAKIGRLLFCVHSLQIVTICVCIFTSRTSGPVSIERDRIN